MDGQIRKFMRYVEWSGVMSFLGFGTLASALSKDYPIWFVLIIAAIGLFLVIFATRNSYRNRSTELFDKYEERFFVKMKQERKYAAQYLLGEHDNSGDLDDVLDFFEAPIAEKVISGEIDANQVWRYFYHWIKLYLQASAEYINEYRKDEPDAWQSLDDLLRIISNIEKKETGHNDKELLFNPQKLQRELQKEAMQRTS